MYRSKRRRRNSLRLAGHNYQNPGAYYVTICTQDRRPLLGRVLGTEVAWTSAGIMVHETWLKLPATFPTISLDHSTIMPDHMHAIIWLHNLQWAIKRGRVDPETERMVSRQISAAGAESAAGRRGVKLENGQVLLPTLERVIQWLKSMTTIAYIRGVTEHNWPSFNRRLWQRGYHDRIIRDQKELERIRRYIHENAQRHAQRRGM